MSSIPWPVRLVARWLNRMPEAQRRRAAFDLLHFGIGASRGQARRLLREMSERRGEEE